MHIMNSIVIYQKFLADNLKCKRYTILKITRFCFKQNFQQLNKNFYAKWDQIRAIQVHGQESCIYNKLKTDFRKFKAHMLT